MMYDYFYGSQSDQFAFYRIPKVLFTEERFKALSTDAKALYGILLDRMNLSARNGWIDKKGACISYSLRKRSWKQWDVPIKRQHGYSWSLKRTSA